MARTTIILPNPASYIDYINKILIDSFEQNIPTSSQVYPTTTVARLLVNQTGVILVEENSEGI